MSHPRSARSSARRLVPVALVVAGLGAGSVAIAATTVRRVSNKGNEFRFTPRLAAPAGKVTLAFTNAGNVDHDIALRGRGLRTVKGRLVGPGKTSRVTANLKKGTYTYFCTVPGHEAAGMKGTLTVR